MSTVIVVVTIVVVIIIASCFLCCGLGWLCGKRRSERVQQMITLTPHDNKPTDSGHYEIIPYAITDVYDQIGEIEPGDDASLEPGGPPNYLGYACLTPIAPPSVYTPLELPNIPYETEGTLMSTQQILFDAEHNIEITGDASETGTKELVEYSGSTTYLELCSSGFEMPASELQATHVQEDADERKPSQYQRLQGDDDYLESGISPYYLGHESLTRNTSIQLPSVYIHMEHLNMPDETEGTMISTQQMLFDAEDSIEIRDDASETGTKELVEKSGSATYLELYSSAFEMPASELQTTDIQEDAAEREPYQRLQGPPCHGVCYEAHPH